MENSTIKKILFIGAILISAVAHSYAQTILPSTTTLHDFAVMKNGWYRIITTTDTTDVTKDTSQIVTISKTCPPPIICPICKTCAAQRIFMGETYNPKTNQWIITYSDGSTTTFVPTTTITIK